MVDSRWVLVVAAAVALAGCASVRQSVNGWFGETPPPAAQQGTAYYAASDALPVHDKASGGSKIVARLPLYTKVTRSNLEAGYAYVTTDGGLAGWVDNAQLIWRLPDADAGTPASSAAPVPAASPTPAETAPAPTAAPVSTPDAQPAPTDTPEPTPAATPEPTASPSPKPRKHAVEMYEPF